MFPYFQRMAEYYRRNRVWIWIIFAIATINALRNIGVLISEDLAHGKPVDLTFYVINESTGSYSVAVLIPFLLFFFKKYPLTQRWSIVVGQTLAGRIFIYLSATVLYGFIHTSLMYITRVPLYQWAGITRLHEIFNDLPYRYLMEYFKQFLAFSVIYLVYWAFAQYRSAKNKEIQAAKLSEDLLNSKLQSLQMQLHPHFFFNTLNTISSVMYRDPDQADQLISGLSTFLRKAIKLKDKAFHSVDDEIELLDEYREIMLSRFSDRLSMVFDVADECGQAQIPVLLLQPLVENAVEHGMPENGLLKVELGIAKANEALRIFVRDDGAGLKEGELQHGIGLQNTMEKLHVCYGADHQIEFQSVANGGLTVQIHIPYRQ